MVNAYAEKVKMIYIDPPYNTGSDGFVYNDDRKFTPEQLSELAGIGLDEATRILEFTTKGSSSHSAWLTFIYPRLYVAKELMCDEGVICISIDENEHSQLKILCDEVFGEHNFITDFVWKNKKGGGNDSVHVAIEHEYILMYSKKIKVVLSACLKRTSQSICQDTIKKIMNQNIIGTRLKENQGNNIIQ